MQLTSRPIRKESHVNPSSQEANGRNKPKHRWSLRKLASSSPSSLMKLVLNSDLSCLYSLLSQSLVSTTLWWLGKRDRPAPAMFVCLPGTDMLAASQFLVFSNVPQTILRLAPHTVTPETKSWCFFFRKQQLFWFHEVNPLHVSWSYHLGLQEHKPRVWFVAFCEVLAVLDLTHAWFCCYETLQRPFVYPVFYSQLPFQCINMLIMCHGAVRL